MRRMRGPLSLSINEEVGLLVEGFDTPPMVMMRALARRTRARSPRLPASRRSRTCSPGATRWATCRTRATKAHDEIAQLPEVTHRAPRTARTSTPTLRIMLDIFRRRLARQLGPRLADARASSRRPRRCSSCVIEPELAIIAEIDGEPAGMCVALPNLNEAIARPRRQAAARSAGPSCCGGSRSRTRRPRGCACSASRRSTATSKRYGALSLAMIAEIADARRRRSASSGAS